MSRDFPGGAEERGTTVATEYRVAFIGCGRIARLHASIYKANARLNIAALADINRAGAEKFAADNGLQAAVYDDYRQMLSEQKPDLVSVCLWPQLHLQAVRDCAEAGIRAVHREKPMAPTWGEALDMVQAARDSGMQLTFGHQRRFLPIFQNAKAVLDSGELGTPERLEAWVHMHLLDMGSHYLDLMFMLNGDTPASWVFGQVDTRQSKAWFSVPCEYAAVGSFRFANGAHGLVHCGEGHGHPQGTGIRVQCSGGVLDMPGWYDTLRVLPYGGPVREERFEKEPKGNEGRDLAPALCQDLLKGLDGVAEPSLSVTNAVHATEVIFAIYESSRQRARIDLPLTARDACYSSLLDGQGVATAA